MRERGINLPRKISILLISIIFLLSGCLNENQARKPYSETRIMTIDGSEVYLDEMMYHIMLAEMEGQLYASVGGNDETYLAIKNGDGKSMAAIMKEQVIDQTIKYELFYQIALENGEKLSETEQLQIEERVQSIQKNIPQEQLQNAGLSEELLTQVQTKIFLATQSYNKFLEKLNVDEVQIKRAFNPLEYQQFDILYIYANEKEKDKLLAKAEEINSEEDIKNLAKSTGLSSGELSFLAGKNTFGEEENLEPLIKNMQVGEISPVVETVKGYYIILLVDNTSKTLYEQEVEAAVSVALEKSATEAYTKLLDKHDIVIDKKVWDHVKIGSFVLEK